MAFLCEKCNDRVHSETNRAILTAFNSRQEGEAAKQLAKLQLEIATKNKGKAGGICGEAGRSEWSILRRSWKGTGESSIVAEDWLEGGRMEELAWPFGIYGQENSICYSGYAYCGFFIWLEASIDCSNQE